MNKYETHENEVAFFITYCSGKVEAFATADERQVVICEIEADEAAWTSA